MKESKSLSQRLYAFLTDPKKVKWSTTAAFMVFGLTIVIGYIIAQFDPAGPGGDLAGYNIIDDFISNMGSIRFTPFPYLLDAGCIITAFLLIPTAFYMEKVLAPLPETAEDIKECSRMRLRLGSIGFAWMVIGLIGMFGVGLFSEDLGIILQPYTGEDLHWIFTMVVFGGLAMGGFFYGILVLFYKTIIPKWLGLYMIFVPSICASILFGTGFIPIFEWMTLMSTIAYLMIGGIYVLKHINKELAAPKTDLNKS